MLDNMLLGNIFQTEKLRTVMYIMFKLLLPLISMTGCIKRFNLILVSLTTYTMNKYNQ